MVTTYLIAPDGEVQTMTRHHRDIWPEHRLDRLISAVEHGETLMACNNHPDFIGSVEEAARHLTEGPWAA